MLTADYLDSLPDSILELYEEFQKGNNMKIDKVVIDYDEKRKNKSKNKIEINGVDYSKAAFLRIEAKFKNWKFQVGQIPDVVEDNPPDKDDTMEEEQEA